MLTSLASPKYYTESFSTVEINSRAYDVYFVKSGDDTVYAKVYSNSFGFVLTKNQNVDISTSINNNKLTIDITVPHGFATPNQSYIEVAIPTTKAFDISLNNYNADTIIDVKDLQINKLNYSTTKGKMVIKSCNLNNTLNLSLKKGSCEITSGVVTSNNNVNLSLTSGKFSATSSTFGEVNVTKNDNGRISIYNCSKFIQDQKETGGQINITQAKFVNIKAADTIVSIDTISDGSIIDLNKSGKINITHLSGVSSLNTNSGNIVVKNSYSILTLKSNSGNISVGSAFQAISVTSNSGKVVINFADVAQDYTEENQHRALYAKMKDGSLTATGVEHVGYYSSDLNRGIYISGSCKLNINFRNVVGVNAIHSENGSINAVINNSSTYELVTSSNHGNVRVNLTQTPQYNGYSTKELTTTYVNCATSDNLLKISSNRGNMTVLDTNFAK